MPSIGKGKYSSVTTTTQGQELTLVQGTGLSGDIPKRGEGHV